LQAGVLSSAPGPGQPPPAWADVPFRPASRRGPAPPSLGVGRPADPARFRPGWAAGWVIRLGLFPAPGWAGTSAPGWAAFPCRPQSSTAPRLGRIRRIRPGRDFLSGRLCLNPAGPECSIPAGPPSVYCSGWARPGFPGPGRIIPLQGRYLLPLGHIPRPASPPARCASPGTPLGSDWHILLRHMLVLGRPLA
jgi:hypothetical protein